MCKQTKKKKVGQDEQIGLQSPNRNQQINLEMIFKGKLTKKIGQQHIKILAIRINYSLIINKVKKLLYCVANIPAVYVCLFSKINY